MAEGYLNNTDYKINNKVKVGPYIADIFVINKNITFTNGVGSADLTNDIPSNKKLSLSFCLMDNTSTLYITGCNVLNNKELEIHCNSTFSGTTTVNILATIRDI